jgi:hypothetical protein
MFNLLQYVFEASIFNVITPRKFNMCVVKGAEYTLLIHLCRGAGKSLARLTSRCILFDGENISFDASLVIYI